MNRYHNGKIYKLINTVDDRIYIGSTATELSKRLYCHKQAAHKNIEQHIYKELNKIGWDNVRIIQIEAYRCETKYELLTKEQHYIDLLKPELNKQAALGQTCIHNRARGKCKDCGGASICIHKKQRPTCIECVGSGLCLHNKQLHHCKICSPAICELCDITTSKGCFKKHLKTETHKNMMLLSSVVEAH